MMDRVVPESEQEQQLNGSASQNEPGSIDSPPQVQEFNKDRFGVDMFNNPLDETQQEFTLQQKDKQEAAQQNDQIYI